MFDKLMAQFKKLLEWKISVYCLLNFSAMILIALFMYLGLVVKAYAVLLPGYGGGLSELSWGDYYIYSINTHINPGMIWILILLTHCLLLLREKHIMKMPIFSVLIGLALLWENWTMFSYVRILFRNVCEFIG